MFDGFWGFQGRIGRGQWWMAQAVIIGITIFLVASGVLAIADTSAEPMSLSQSLITLVLSIASLVINFSSTVKRFHDRDKSGRWALLLLVPFIGGIWVLIECGFCSGDDTINSYGPPPGFAKRQAELDAEISGMGNSKIAKLDDAYLADYARQIAMKQAEAQMSAAATSNGFNGGQARPVFGKR